MDKRAVANAKWADHVRNINSVYAAAGIATPADDPTNSPTPPQWFVDQVTQQDIAQYNRFYGQTNRHEGGSRRKRRNRKSRKSRR